MAEKLSSGYVELTVDDKKAKKAVKALFEDAEKPAKSAGKSAGDSFAKSFKGSTTKMAPDMKHADREAGRAGKDAGGSFTRMFKSSAKPTADYRTGAASAGRAGRDAGNAFTRMFKSAANVNVDVTRLAPAVGRVGGTAGRMFGGAFLGALAAMGLANSVQAIFQTAADTARDVFNTGLGFEKVMNSIQGVSNATVAQMSEVRTVVRNLGSDVNLAGTSAADAGDAILELVKGGLSLKEAMDAARGTLQLATAAQIGAGDAATYVADALAIWQRPGTDAVRVADMLANAANASTGEASDYALAMAQAGNVAAGFGVSMEDTITALAMFAKFGVKGSDAGTLMKTSLQAITDQGNPAQGAIAELNLELYRGGKFVGYPEMLRQVAVASERMSQEQFQAATNVLFGSDAMRASMVAANGGSDSFADLRARVTEAGGAARMAGAQMQGIPGVMESISNTAEGLKLELFDMVDDGIQGAGEKFSETMEGWLTWLKTHRPEVIEFFRTITDGALGAADAMLSFTSLSLNALAQLLEGFNTAFPGIFEGLEGFGKVIKFIPGFGDVGRAMENLGDAFDEGLTKGPGILRDIAGQVEDMHQPLADVRKDVLGFLDNLKAGEEASREFGVSVDLLPDNKTFVLNENSDEAKKKLEDLGLQIRELPDGKFEVVPGTPEAQAKLDKFIEQNKLLPEVTLPITPDMSAVQAALNGFLGKLAGRNPFAGGASADFGNVAPNSTLDDLLGGGGGEDTGGSVLPQTQRLIDRYKGGGFEVGGYRAPDGYNEHSSGHAADVMVPNATAGNTVAADALTQPNVEYVIWNNQIWYPDGSREPYNGPNPHTDHVHVKTYDQGGWLRKGFTAAVNKTGKPELVLTNEQAGNAAGAIAGAGLDPGSIADGFNAVRSGAIQRGFQAAGGDGAALPFLTGDGRLEGYIPAAAGSTSVSGKSVVSSAIGIGGEVINGLIDQAASAASSAVAAGITAGTFGAGAAGGGQAGAAAAQLAIGMGTNAAKRGVTYAFDLLGIGADALLEQLTPFGMPRWLTHDYSGFMPRLDLSPAATTSLEGMEQALHGQQQGALPGPGGDTMQGFLNAAAKMPPPQAASTPPMFNIQGDVYTQNVDDLGRALTKQAQLNMMQYAGRP